MDVVDLGAAIFETAPRPELPGLLPQITFHPEPIPRPFIPSALFLHDTITAADPWRNT